MKEPNKLGLFGMIRKSNDNDKRKIRDSYQIDGNSKY